MSKKAASIGQPGPTPIQRRKLGHEVLDRLLNGIRAGDWPPGSELPSERELMTAYGVGRPAVREALQSLERMGLIAIAHGARARVLTPSADSVLRRVGEAARLMLETSPGALQHLKEARLLFEVSMVRIAAQAATRNDITRLRHALEAQRQASQETSSFLTKDMEFHRTIAEMTGNPIFVAIAQSVFEWLARFHVELVRAPGAEKLTLAEHDRILKALEARDPDAAARAMKNHLTRANKLYATLMRSIEK